MSYYRPVFKEDNLNEITSPDYIATEYVFNRQSLNDLTHGYPVFVNSKTVDDTPRSTPTSQTSSSTTKRSRTIHNMKKLFNNKSKKASNPDLAGAAALNAHATGHTLDRIVSLKAEPPDIPKRQSSLLCRNKERKCHDDIIVTTAVIENHRGSNRSSSSAKTAASATKASSSSAFCLPLNKKRFTSTPDLLSASFKFTKHSPGLIKRAYSKNKNGGGNNSDVVVVQEVAVPSAPPPEGVPVQQRPTHLTPPLLPPKPKGLSSCISSPQGGRMIPTHTLDRLVRARTEEKRKWELEKEEFDRRQREHEIHLLEIEQKEVERREEEVRKRNDELADKRRKNKLVQDKMQEQIKALEQKLIEFRSAHRKEEEDLEDSVRVMEDQLFDVKSDMEKRMRSLNLAFDPAHATAKRDSLNSEYSHATTVPAATAPPGSFFDETDEFDTSNYKYGSSMMYPAIPVLTKSYETSRVLQVGGGGGEGVNPSPQPRSSLGSSPKSSHSDSRSDTPKQNVNHTATGVGDSQSDKSGEFADFGSASSV